MDKRIVVAIDEWGADSMYPSGHYVRTLGIIGDRDTETVRQRGERHRDQGQATHSRHMFDWPMPDSPSKSVCACQSGMGRAG